MEPFDGLSEAQLLQLLDLNPLAQHRLSLVTRLLKLSDSELSEEVLELAHEFDEEGDVESAIELLKLYEENRGGAGPVHGLLVTLLEMDNRTVELLERLDALGPTASPSLLKKRLVLRATDLGDWVGTFIRICAALGDPDVREIGYDALKEVLNNISGAINMIQFARFVVRQPNIDRLTVAETVLSYAKSDEDSDAFIRTVLEEGGYDEGLMRIWLGVRGDDARGEVVAQLLASERSLLMQTSPETFYPSLLKSKGLADDLVVLILAHWFNRSRTSTLLQEEVLRQFDAGLRAGLVELMHRIEPTSTGAFRLSILRRCLDVDGSQLSGKRRELFLRELEAAEPENTDWTQRRLALAREDDALERRHELLVRLVKSAGDNNERRDLLEEHVSVLKRLGDIQGVLQSSEQLMELVAEDERVSLLKTLFDFVRSKDLPLEMIRVGLMLIAQPDCNTQRYDAAQRAFALGEWSKCLELLGGLSDVNSIRLRVQCFVSLGNDADCLVELQQLISLGSIQQEEASRALTLMLDLNESVETLVRYWTDVEALGWTQDEFLRRLVSMDMPRSLLETIFVASGVDRFVAAVKTIWLEVFDALPSHATELLDMSWRHLGASDAEWLHATASQLGQMSIWAEFVCRHPVELETRTTVSMLVDAIRSITDINQRLQLSRRLLEQSNETALIANMLWSVDSLSSSEECLN